MTHLHEHVEYKMPDSNVHKPKQNIYYLDFLKGPVSREILLLFHDSNLSWPRFHIFESISEYFSISWRISRVEQTIWCHRQCEVTLSCVSDTGILE